MKYIITLIVAVVLGFLSARFTAVWQSSAWETRFLSEVIMPTEYAISNVNRDLKSGRINLVRKKLEILDRGYQEFRKGGPRPEMFLRDLYKMDRESQQPDAEVQSEGAPSD